MITPNELFFVRNHAPTPQIDVSEYRLRVEGDAIDEALELTMDDLLALPNESVVAYLECGGNWRGFWGSVVGRPAAGGQWGTGPVAKSCRLLDFRLLSADRAPVGALQLNTKAYLDCVFRTDHPRVAVTVAIDLWWEKNHVFTAVTPAPIRAWEPGVFQAGILLPAHFLNETRYLARATLLVQRFGHENQPPEVVGTQEFDFFVMNTDPANSAWADWTWGRPGLISPKLKWSTQGPAMPAAVPYELQKADG